MSTSASKTASLAELSDGELYARAREGDRQAATVLWCRHEHRILARLRQAVGATDARDLLHTLFVDIIRTESPWDGRALFSTWLQGAVTNALRQYFRRRKRDSVVEPVGHEIPEIPNTETPEELAGRASLRPDLLETLAQIDALHRQVLVLRHVEGLTTLEIAALLDKPAGTVRSRLTNARQKWAELLKKRGWSAAGAVAVVLWLEARARARDVIRSAAAVRASAAVTAALLLIGSISMCLWWRSWTQPPADVDWTSGEDVSPPRSGSEVEAATPDEVPVPGHDEDYERATIPRAVESMEELTRARIAPAWREMIGRHADLQGAGSNGAYLPMDMVVGLPQPWRLEVDELGRFSFGRCRGRVQDRGVVATCGTTPYFLVGMVHPSGTFVALNAYVAIWPGRPEWADLRGTVDMVLAPWEGVLLVSDQCDPLEMPSGRSTHRTSFWWADIPAASVANASCDEQSCPTLRFAAASVTAGASVRVSVAEPALLAAFAFLYGGGGWIGFDRCEGVECEVGPHALADRAPLLPRRLAGVTARDGVPVLQEGDGPGLSVRMADVGRCPSEFSIGAAEWVERGGVPMVTTHALP